MKYVMGAYDWTIPTALPLSRCSDQSDIDLFGVDIDTFNSDNGFVDVARYTFEDFMFSVSDYCNASVNPDGGLVLRQDKTLNIAKAIVLYNLDYLYVVDGICMSVLSRKKTRVVLGEFCTSVAISLDLFSNVILMLDDRVTNFYIENSRFSGRVAKSDLVLDITSVSDGDYKNKLRALRHDNGIMILE